MAYPFEIKQKAIELRKKGYSLNEIVVRTKVVKSTISLWVRNVELDDIAKQHLLTKIKRGQLISRENKRKKIKNQLDSYYQYALQEYKKAKLNREAAKILCAMIYWCEGAKNHYSGVRFTNSDPKLVKTFLVLFRASFDLDESKFRVCVHLHGYHDASKQLDFWSKVTNIKRGQFIQPYRKPNTSKRIREGYQGCISIYYHSNDMARHLLMIAKAFFSVNNEKKVLTGA